MTQQNTINALKKAIQNDAQSQSDFAIRCGIERSTLSHDISGVRKIPDDRFHQYLLNVSEETRSNLIRARLKDLIPTELHNSIFCDQKLREGDFEIPQIAASLTPKVKAALHWLAEEVAEDPNLEQILILLCSRLGWDETSVKY